MKSRIKNGFWLLMLSEGLMFGCTNAPLPQKAAWPWEYGKDYGKYQTGDFITFRGNVADFGQPPKAAKQVSSEAIEPRIPDSAAAPGTSPSKKQTPSMLEKSEPSPAEIADKSTEYDFSLRDVVLTPATYLPTDTVRPVYDITAFNRGNAPVSVAIEIDPTSSRSISADKALPLTAVVPPHSDKVLVSVTHKGRGQSQLRYRYSWSIGDYTASHNSPEHYRFPFGNSVPAFVEVNPGKDVSPYARYAVIFVMPVGTPVLAARNGTVVRTKPDKIDVLHGDSTIATYNNLGRIFDGISAGRSISAGDVIGEVGTTVDQKEGYMQLTVWRPEAGMVASLGTDFDFVSFPLRFCSSDSGECRVLTENQPISRDKPAKKARRKGKQKPRQQ